MFEKDDIPRVPNDTLQEQVYRQLRHLLMTGHFRPGQALKIRDLAESFSTSMQPVREAIRQLVAERALEASPNASTRVPRLNHAQLEDLRSIRITVEGLAAERALARMKKADIDELERILSAEMAADDDQHIAASVARNLEFHFRLYSHSGSDILPSIIEGLWLRLGPSIRDAAELFDARNGKGGAHHRDMLKALRRADAVAIRTAVEQDINRFFAVLAEEQTAIASTPHERKRRLKIVAAGSDTVTAPPRVPAPRGRPRKTPPSQT
ncbi:GntR family transcriptional regulator [Robbsia andropogonis]|uniref:GntR family transcriptional regulator n=1 Tax=Robbsia andropogonis TaxID=28092 RepID=UPI003D1B688E